jgi:hypothetical protein
MSIDKNSVSYKVLQHFVASLKEKMDTMPVKKTEQDSGRSMAYYEATDLILECSRIFRVKIKDFDPEKLL